MPEALSRLYLPGMPDEPDEASNREYVDLNSGGSNESHEALGSNIIPLDGAASYTRTLTADATFSTSGRAAGRSVAVRILPGVANRTVNFPAWKWLNATIPTVLQANKIYMLSLRIFSGTAEGDVHAAIAEVDPDDQPGLVIIRETLVWDEVGFGAGPHFTFNKADYPWLVAVRARAVGGGGGGQSSSTDNHGGGGGGAGGYSESTIEAANLPASVGITIGVGGSGGINGGDGGNGDPTMFGSFVIANGGGGGGIGTSQHGRYGTGAIAGEGDVTFPGADGHPGGGSLSIVAAGNGGDSIFGGGGAGGTARASNESGRAGRAPGAGGGGGFRRNANVNGGHGQDGIVILELLGTAPGSGATPDDVYFKKTGGVISNSGFPHVTMQRGANEWEFGPQSSGPTDEWGNRAFLLRPVGHLGSPNQFLSDGRVNFSNDLTMAGSVLPQFPPVGNIDMNNMPGPGDWPLGLTTWHATSGSSNIPGGRNGILFTVSRGNFATSTQFFISESGQNPGGDSRPVPFIYVRQWASPTTWGPWRMLSTGGPVLLHSERLGSAASSISMSIPSLFWGLFSGYKIIGRLRSSASVAQTGGRLEVGGMGSANWLREQVTETTHTVASGTMSGAVPCGPTPAATAFGSRFSLVEATVHTAIHGSAPTCQGNIIASCMAQSGVQYRYNLSFDSATNSAPTSLGFFMAAGDLVTSSSMEVWGLPKLY